MRDRRANRDRAVPPQPITVALSNNRNTQAYGVMANISEVGGCVFTSAAFDVGEGIVLSLGAPWMPEPIEAPGSIVWTGKGSPGTAHYGLKFESTKKVRLRLRELIKHFGDEPLPGQPSGRRLPTTFGRYEVQGLVGEGSMGRVYRAYDPMAKRLVAIKTLKTEYLSSSRGEDYLKRFRREAQAAANLAHPNIITLFDVGDSYFVMELVAGVTLHALLQQQGRLVLAEALRILGPVAEGLDFAHSKGIIHRDIKPSNIMILPDGGPKIMDFGVAHFISTTKTASGGLVGSPSYMAPEQITASQASPRTDLFSLAAVAYEMLTGGKCFDGESIAQIVHSVVSVEVAPPSSRNPELPARFDEVFRRALAKDPSVRFPSGSSFVAALGRRSADAVLAAIPVPSPPEHESVSAIDDAPTHDLSGPPQSTPKNALGRTGDATSWWSLIRLDARYALGTLVLAAAVVAFALRYGSGSGPLAESAPPLKVGAIEVGTEPLGASVWLDGAEAGRSPLTLSKLTPGRHAVRVALAGFSPAELTLDVPAGVFAVPLRFTLQPVSPILQVRSEPEGADVFVDGQARGTTPLETLSIPTGKHRVEITRDGFAPWTQNVTAHAGDRIPLLGRLQPRTDRANTAHLQSQGFVHPGDFLEAGHDVTPPQKISGEVAPYPESARKLKLHGTVTIEMTINERGEPTDLRVVESAGETLDAAVLAAVATWRYTPPEKNGVKVQTRLQVKQTFAESR